MRRPSSASRPFFVLLAAAALGLLAVAWAVSVQADKADRLLRDRYLAMKPAERAAEGLLVLAPERPGAWPQLRASDSVALLRLLDEFGASGLVLSGEPFKGGRQAEELAELRRELPGVVDRECASIESSLKALVGAIRTGSLPPGALPTYTENLVAIIRQGGERIKETAGASSSPTLAELDRELGRLATQSSPKRTGKAGAPIQSDSDGVLRLLPLVDLSSGAPEPAEALACFFRPGSETAMEFRPGRLVLHGAVLPDGSRRDLSIPMDAGRRALVPWPRSASPGEAHILSLGELLDLISDEEAFVSRLRSMEAEGLLVVEGSALMSRYAHVEGLGAALPVAGDAATPAAKDWREGREAFFLAAKAYFDGGYEESLVAQIEVFKNTRSLSQDALEGLDERSALIRGSYQEAREELAALLERRTTLAARIRDSVIFFSPDADPSAFSTASGQPTSPAFAEALLAAAAIEGRVPRALPAALSAVLAALGLLGMLALAWSKGPETGMGRGALCGLGLGVAGAVVSVAAFAFWRAYLPPLALVLGPWSAALVLALAWLRRRPRARD